MSSDFSAPSLRGRVIEKLSRFTRIAKEKVCGTVMNINTWLEVVRS